MSRYKPKPIHSAAWIEEHQPDKYTKQILAGEALLQKFLKKTNNKYDIKKEFLAVLTYKNFKEFLENYDREKDIFRIKKFIN